MEYDPEVREVRMLRHTVDMNALEASVRKVQILAVRAKREIASRRMQPPIPPVST